MCKESREVGSGFSSAIHSLADLFCLCRSHFLDTKNLTPLILCISKSLLRLGRGKKGETLKVS